LEDLLLKFSKKPETIGRTINIVSDIVTLEKIEKSLKKIGLNTPKWKFPYVGFLPKDIFNQFKWNQEYNWNFDPKEVTSFIGKTISLDECCQNHKEKIQAAFNKAQWPFTVMNNIFYASLPILSGLAVYCAAKYA